jgi:hypothetical protein
VFVLFPSHGRAPEYQARNARSGPFFALEEHEPYVLERTECRFQREHNAAMKIKFTDEDKYPRGYVRSESTDITKTFAAARARFALAEKQPEGNVRMLQQVGGART